MTSYSLKAACEHCNGWGTIDDRTLICFQCKQPHVLTEEQRRARDQEIASVRKHIQPKEESWPYE